MPPSNESNAGASGVFIQTIAAISGGKYLAKLDDALREAVKASRTAVGKSKLSIELTIAPNGFGVGGEPLFKVSPGKIKKALPEKTDDGANFFVDDNDNLSRRNPGQGEMKLTVVEGGAEPSISKDDLKAAAGK